MERDLGTMVSDTVLELKFMKRTKEKVQKEQEEAEGQAMYSGEITLEMKRKGNIIFREAGIALCKGLVDGRLSFGGMNPEVEKLMNKDYNKALNRIELAKEKDVSDEQMAKGYSTLVKTMNNKFKPKKQRNTKFKKQGNTMFKKPPKDDALI